MIVKKNELPRESYFKKEEANKKQKAKKGRSFVPIEKYEQDSKVKIDGLLDKHDNSNCNVERQKIRN